MTVIKERDYWLGFNVFPGIGPKRFYHLLKVFGSAKRAWQASEEKLSLTKIPKKILNNFLEFREKFKISTELLRVSKQLIRFIIVDDKEYPSNLKKIDVPPPLIYIKGRLFPQDALSIAVIGTRKITPYGREVTEKLSSVLSSRGLTIVSGLARGVDSIAHRVALGNNGRTIAVLGCGLNEVYPPEHKVLAEKIVSLDLGAVISELPLGTAPLKGNFVSRNRIIAGLSLGVLVTEGATVSGTKITSDFCFKYKRPLFAVPGPITSPFSEGPADLIKKGARLVTKAEDILNELRVSRVPQVARVSREGKIKFNNQEEEKIWQILVTGAKHIDELIRLSGIPSDRILSLLTTMEIAGKVKSIGMGNYILL